MIKMKPVAVPDEVVDTFNDLIKKCFKNHKTRKAVIKQCEVLYLVRKKFNKSGRLREANFVFDYGWLDGIKPLFKEKGWKVIIDRPSYNEYYEPTFTFYIRKNHAQ